MVLGSALSSKHVVSLGAAFKRVCYCRLHCFFSILCAIRVSKVFMSRLLGWSDAAGRAFSRRLKCCKTIVFYCYFALFGSIQDVSRRVGCCDFLMFWNVLLSFSLLLNNIVGDCSFRSVHFKTVGMVGCGRQGLLQKSEMLQIHRFVLLFCLGWIHQSCL